MPVLDYLRATLLALVLLTVFGVAWHLAVSTTVDAPDWDDEYAMLMGASARGESAIPGPLDVTQNILEHLRSPWQLEGSTEPGLGVQLAYSVVRVLAGFTLAALVAIPLGFALGMSPIFYQAFNPFIQLLKPVSPLAWLPLALYTIKDANLSSVFIIFICSVWPMVINTAFGVASVRREWLNVARTLEASFVRTAYRVILPAAAPTIMTGMRISIGIAWLVIVAAEMLVGGTGIGYFVWNEWNNLSLVNIITAIFFIGVVGMILDFALASLARLTAYTE